MAGRHKGSWWVVGLFVTLTGLIGLPTLWNNRRIILDFLRADPIRSGLALLCLALVLLALELWRRLRDERTRLIKKDQELDYLQGARGREADIAQYNRLLALLPADGNISFLRGHDFGAPFRAEDIEELQRLWRDHKQGHTHQFFDTEIESRRLKLFETVDHLLDVIIGYTGALEPPRAGQDNPEGVRWLGIGSEYDHRRQAYQATGKADLPEYYHRRINEMNTASDDVVGAYDSLVRTARQRLRI